MSFADIMAAFAPGERTLPVMLERQAIDGDVIERAKQFRLDDQQPGAGIAQNMLQLRPARSDIDRDCDRAEPGAAKKAFHEFGPVGAH